jgi:hypothetical protein
LDRSDAIHSASRSADSTTNRREAADFEVPSSAMTVRRLGRERLRRLLPIGSIKLLQIARDALLELCPAPLHFRARKVAVADC